MRRLMIPVNLTDFNLNSLSIKKIIVCMLVLIHFQTTHTRPIKIILKHFSFLCLIEVHAS